jgi:16S rRNA processing protein RimM
LKNDSTRIAIGRLGRTKGLRGEIFIDLYNPQSETLGAVESVFVGNSKLNLEKVHASGQRTTLKFREASSVDEVKTFVGQEIFVERSALPKLGKSEFYVSDLIGMDVVNESGTKVGTLKDVTPTGSNDVYVVETSGEELLLPAIPSVILKIDSAHRKIVVSVPESVDAF